MRKIFTWIWQKFTWIRRQWRKIAIGMLCLPFVCYACLYILHWLFPYPQELLQPHHSLEIQDCQGNLLMSFLDEQGNWNYPVPLQKISPLMQKAMISAEDKNFYQHHGVDMIALIRALGGNITGLRKYSGASTITMQAVRLIEPRPRTLRSKIIEAFRAWQLEKILSKDQILEIYLNRTPYGRNLIGAEAAARCYLDKSASDLTIAEAALLAGLPQSPSGYRPDRRLPRSLKRRGYVLRRMAEDGIITPEQAKESGEQTPTILRYNRHFSAAHWCFMLREKYRQSNLKQIRSTLDSSIQSICERALRNGLARYQWRDISNGCVLVVENRTGAIRAWVGSANFFSSEIQGQINGGTTQRSPGSLLKPFTYLLAFEQGLADPGTILYDVELATSDYRPANYDREFTGLVTARQALRSSLNLPVIRVQQQLGTKPLLEFYQKIGLSSLQQSPEYYGLTLTLGTSETTPLEIATAYTTLARQGIPIQLRYEESSPLVLGQRLFSEQAAFLTHDILSDTDPLHAENIYLRQDCPRLAWKTGTSSGNRDAWTVVYNPEWTIVVWLGNFNNRGAKSLVGIEAAAPIACDIFGQLPCPNAGWYAVPQGVQKRTVCSVSGCVPIPHCCPSTYQEWAIVDTPMPITEDAGSALPYEMSPSTPCRIHIPVQINLSTGMATCRHCASPDDPLDVREQWPVYVAAWLQKHGRSQNLMPPHNPQCPSIRSSPLTIVKPAQNSHYTLQPGEIQYIELQAVSTSGAALYWFQNGQYLTQTVSGQSYLYLLKHGNYEFSCVNESGQQASVNIKVK